MTGVQPRPLRYSGRLNRRGRKARGLRFRMLARGVGRVAPGAGVREGDMLVVDANGYVRPAKYVRASVVRELFQAGRVTLQPRAGAR